MARRLAAIVLNYGTPDRTWLTVRSVLHSTRAVDVVVVVDNGDGVACRGALHSVLDRVVVCATGSNLGYAGGMNVGIREARSRDADLVLLVNSDVMLPPHCIGRLEAALTDSHRDHPTGRIGIVGPVIMNSAAPDVVASAGISYNAITGRMRLLFHGGAMRPAALHRHVDAVSGCVMLLDREVLDTVGDLDEEYFFGFEDVDICLRARRARFATVVATSTQVFHDGGRSIGPHSTRRLYYAARNHQRLAASTGAGGPALTPIRALNVVLLNVAHALRPTGGSLIGRLAAVLRGTRDALIGRYGVAP